MSKDKVIDSLGRIDDDMIEETAKLRTETKKKGKWRRRLALAACFLLIVSMGVTAEATTGIVSNLLAPLFGSAQTEIVNNIGVPVGASVSADGYTMTVDAIIGDRYNTAMVYTLSSDDGQPLPESVYFEDWIVEPALLFLRGSGSQTFTRVIDEEDPSRIYFVQTWSRNMPLIGRHINSYFSNLMVYNEDGEDTFLAAGPWELKYTLRYPDSTVKVPVKDLKVTDEFGKEYIVEKILISPVGIYMDVTLLDVVWGDTDMVDFNVSLLLKDGTLLELPGGGGASYAKGDETADGNYREMYSTPIPPENIEALIICDTTYPVELSEK